MGIEAPISNVPLDEWDPSLPRFHFSEKERQERRKRGMTDEEITAEESIITSKQIQHRLEQKTSIPNNPDDWDRMVA